MMVTAHHVDDVYTPALAVTMAMVRDGGSESKSLISDCALAFTNILRWRDMYELENVLTTAPTGRSKI